VFRINEIIGATGGRLIRGNLGDKVRGISTDSRELKAGDAFLALKGNNFDGHDFIASALRAKAACIIAQNATGLVVPRGTALIRVKDTTLALGDIARFQRQKFYLPVIAVTGSAGKTTTKEMIAWVLSAGACVLKNEGTKNNQIGLPQTLLKLKAKDDYAVVEIGSNHFGEVGYLSGIALPNIGVVTNIGPAHLEFLKNLKGVFREKSGLLNNLSGPAIALLNSDDKFLRALINKKRTGPQIFCFGINEKSDFSASKIRMDSSQARFKVNGRFDFVLSTPGSYNIYNALPAIALGRVFGMDYRKIASRLADFKFPKGRLSFFRFRGAMFIDDTYNSNPLSLRRSLETLKNIKVKGRRILVMGDMLELGAQKESLHRGIAGSITDICDLLVTCGDLARLTAKSAASRGLKRGNIFCCSSAQEAGELLFNKISPGTDDVVLVKGSRGMKMEEVFKV